MTKFSQYLLSKKRTLFRYVLLVFSIVSFSNSCNQVIDSKDKALNPYYQKDKIIENKTLSDAEKKQKTAQVDSSWEHETFKDTIRLWSWTGAAIFSFFTFLYLSGKAELNNRGH